MKKILLIMLGLLMALPMLALTFTYKYKGQKLVYTTTGSGDEVSVYRYDNTLSGDLVIPEKVTRQGTEYTVISIGERAFSSCRDLTSVEIPNSVTSIGADAFWNCISLTSVEIPNSVTSIGGCAFMDCSGLTTVKIPNSVTSIGEHVFYKCRGLKSVEIPNSVTSIGDGVFRDCISLTSVYYGADRPVSATANCFSDETYEKATLYMPEDGAVRARELDPWKNFRNIEVFEFSSIDEIASDIDEDAPYEIYNLRGMKVGDCMDALSPGTYIIRQGSVVKKIAVK